MKHGRYGEKQHDAAPQKRTIRGRESRQQVKFLGLKDQPKLARGEVIEIYRSQPRAIVKNRDADVGQKCRELKHKRPQIQQHRTLSIK
ncbi:hypothetical protein DSM3645_24645 [Blastopirellula marina DSM 3645]|uniref:Uncharacterized protein n=1 Tax=Blastopirellula marina DSM 3645 TaxID=314230 RepID=A3ZV20_9BACT|nr:hypothetical protein DSM3645_24645 [Blastopirellula marina DSM 3645]